MLAGYASSSDEEGDVATQGVAVNSGAGDANGAGSGVGASALSAVAPAKEQQTTAGEESSSEESESEEATEAPGSTLGVKRLRVGSQPGASAGAGRDTPAAKAAAVRSAATAFVPPQVRSRGRVVSVATDNISDHAFEKSSR
mmetsp:Transcript_79875/g.230905  ORF Transcript_79875/g.230905 Transcript_79875/m.230905 type:complete len:142 (+) Transcript_79875:91-516(+)